MSFTEYMIGKREQISWKEEATYGTAVTPDLIVGKDVTVSPNFSKSWQEVVSAGADTRNINSMVQGPEDLRFTLEFIPTDWVFMKYVMGAVTDADEGTYYSHTFALADTVQSFTLEWAKRGSTNHVITLAGCVVLNATISFSKATGAGSEGHIRVSLDCVAKTASQGSSITTISAPTATPFQYRMVKFTLDGNEITEVNSGELTLATGIEPNDSRYCNDTLDVALGEPIPKTFRINGRTNVNIKDKTYWDLWDAATAVSGAVSIAFTRDTNDDMTFTFTSFYPTGGGWVGATNLDGVTVADLPFQAVSVAAVANDGTATY